MVIMENIDSIFDLHMPSLLYYPSKNQYDNSKIEITNKEELFKGSITKSFVNGGILLFKPSKYLFKVSLKTIKKVIQNNCMYPNETLFLYTMRNLYNLPVIYNMSYYYLKEIPEKYKNKIKIYHFNNTIYKPLDMIQDNWYKKDTNQLRKKIVIYYKKMIYNKFKNKVKKMMVKV